MTRRLSITRDEVLIDEYSKIPELSSEAIIRDPDLSASLLGDVNKRLHADQKFTEVELKKRLENLRKVSKLPRKFREFNGRNVVKAKPH